MRRRYLVLRAFSLIMRIIGWIGVILGLALFIYGLVAILRLSAGTADLLLARDVLGAGVGFVIAGLLFVLYGELIEVFFDIEANTRRTVALLERLVPAAPASPPPP